MSPVAENKWVKVGQKGSGPGPRSSHALTVVGNKVYCFGGELKPTIHIDNDLYVFDLETQEWSIAPATGDAPFPCFGVSMVPIGTTIYVYGGRDDTRRYNGLYSYDTLTNKWEMLSPVEEGLPGRSYHSMACDDRNVYVFGGVTAKGRVNTLHGYDVVGRKWVEYPAGGEACKGRGGPGLVVVEGRFGFCLGLTTTGDVPPARSVFPAVRSGKEIVVYGGEEEPHELMHMGAGKLSGEVYRLDTETLVWEKVVDGTEEGKKPSPRGWCAFAVAVKDGEEGLLVHGGNSPTNERLDDMVFWRF
ncbi:hypothetical protein HID58_007393 [Brassica napus]|uniref:Nitrile-specifier protein 5 n=1 Tax=Brassica napus TaxID=3708 RepID=A0ABQ8EE33_BRANA|nr:hypothetical protein HID58_007393 [Brassica napus]